MDNVHIIANGDEYFSEQYIKKILTNPKIYGISLYTQLTKDLKIVISNYKTLYKNALKPKKMSIKKFTQLVHTNISKLTIQDINTIYIKTKFNTILTLKQVLTIIPENKYLILTVNNEETIYKLISYYKKKKLKPTNIFFISSNISVIHKLKKKLPLFKLIYNITHKITIHTLNKLHCLDLVDGILLSIYKKNKTTMIYSKENINTLIKYLREKKKQIHINIHNNNYDSIFNTLTIVDIVYTNNIPKTITILNKKFINIINRELNLNFIEPKNTINSPYKPMMNLGCISANTSITDIVPINIKWPQYQNPTNFDNGSSGPNFSNSSSRNTSTPQTNDPSNTSTPQTNDPSNTSTPFQSSVYLNSNVRLYNIAATANGYGNITLSTEGLLWTLWPLANNNIENIKKGKPDNYLDNFNFGTSLVSNYPIGQMGYFSNNKLLGCTSMGTGTSTQDTSPPATGKGQSGLIGESPAISSGVQGYSESFLNMTGQYASIIVIKVTEEIARIFNPIAGIGNNERFIYVGYDGWSVFRITSNPIGPMMTQTYVSPQTVTGTVTRNNLQTILPPNFPQTIFFKNINYLVPIDPD